MDVLNPQWHSVWRRLARPVTYWMALAALASSANTISPPRVAAQSEALAEYQVKAAFLFNFAKFVEWPDTIFADVHAPIVVGIVGDNPFGDHLSHIVTGQLVRGRTIRIRKYQFGDDLRSCHLIFVSASELVHTSQILASLQGTSILTVGDTDGFAEAGGAMQFVVEESRVRFVVNLDAATQAKLRISAKLLALARVINRVENPGAR